jgi:hypothetical protein
VIWRNHLFRLLTSELSNYSYRIYGPRRSLRYVIERLAAARKEAGLELSPDLKRIRTRLIGRCVSSPGHRTNSGCLRHGLAGAKQQSPVLKFAHRIGCRFQISSMRKG